MPNNGDYYRASVRWSLTMPLQDPICITIRLLHIVGNQTLAIKKSPSTEHQLHYPVMQALALQSSLLGLPPTAHAKISGVRGFAQHSLALPPIPAPAA